MWSGQRYRGGRFIEGGMFNRQNATVYVDPRGDLRTGIPSSIILMHELVGHGHPVGRNIAHHDVNYFYEEKLGIRRSVGYRNTYNEERIPGHGPYKWRAPRLTRTGLFKR
jgi:hypothetical protein